MTPIAHVSGIPVEELLPLLSATAGVWAGVRVLVAKLGRLGRAEVADVEDSAGTTLSIRRQGMNA